MIFNSVTFLLFLIIVVVFYWVLPRKVNMWMLLIASFTFYGFWRWEFLSIMLISALTDYFTAIAIYNTPIRKNKKRKFLLALTLFINLGLLCYFKYLYFFTENINNFLNIINIDFSIPLIKVILPFGISFYTFETISYTVDVYRGIIKPEKSFLNYGLFVTFFPKLVAGPIQRASELLTQLKNKPHFQLNFITEGIKRILYGLFLKVLLADNISPLVNEGFAVSPDMLSAIDVWALAFLFGFQIYFDFSAYSHIAVGAAKLMGISIPENFNFPYIATSFKNFWKRWHISLSSWIRDYLYLPLSGVKVVNSKGSGGIGEGLENTSWRSKTKALFLTWAIMGLWHGANWTFIVWGIYHATLVYIERKLSPIKTKFPILNNSVFGWMITLPLTMLSWIPFRAQSLEVTMTMFYKVFSIKKYSHLNLRENDYIIVVLLVLIVTLMYFINTYLEERLKKIWYFYFVLNCIKFAIIITFVFTFLRPISQFIYFQF